MHNVIFSHKNIRDSALNKQEFIVDIIRRRFRLRVATNAIRYLFVQGTSMKSSG